MRITSLNCGTFRPPMPFPGMSRLDLVTHVLLIETQHRLILIDTGVGKKQMLDLNRTLKGRLQGALMGLQQDPDQTASEQLKRAGYSPADVTDVILTHLDTDHVGGLSDFPQARAHLFRTELESANHPRTRFEKLRFLKDLWQNHPHFELYGIPGQTGHREAFHDFELIPLKGIPEEITLIALPGHTPGHAGVYLRERNFVFAGDACLNQGVLTEASQPVPVRIYQATTTMNPEAWHQSVQGLKKLCACGVTVCCAHDREQFEKYSNEFKSLY